MAQKRLKILAVLAIGLIAIYSVAVWRLQSQVRLELSRHYQKAIDARVRPTISGGRLGLALELRRPEFTIPWSGWTRQAVHNGQLSGDFRPPVPVVLVKVREGKIHVIDAEVDPPVQWDFRGVQADLHARSDKQYAFKISGEIEGEGGAKLGDLHLEGDVVSEGPLEVDVKLHHNKIGLLAPYLRKVLGTTPDWGVLQLKSHFTLRDGVLMSHHDVIAAGVRFPSDQPTTLGMEGNRLMELLADREGKVHLSFMVNGRPGEGLDWSDLISAALQESMRQGMTRSIQRTLDAAQQLPVEERLRNQLDSLGR